jgi:hypothetical protein
MQLEVEVQKLYALKAIDLALFVSDTSNLLSLSDYIKEWRLTIWEIAFFSKLKSKDGIPQNKAWE